VIKPPIIVVPELVFNSYASYIHQWMCSPPSATPLGALNRSAELTNIPGVTPMLIKNHLPRSNATDKGRMRRHRSNTASTQNVKGQHCLHTCRG
jgi:hypothetical protein